MARQDLRSRPPPPRLTMVSTAYTRGEFGRSVHIGPSGYVEWLDDRKSAFVRLAGRTFGDVPLNLEYLYH